MKTKLSMMVLFALLLTAVGCGDDETKLFLQPFRQNNIELQTNQDFNLSVTLSGESNEVQYVDIENPQSDAIQIVPSPVIKFGAGDTEKIVTVTGLKETTGDVQIVFTLRDTTSKHTFVVSVKAP